MRKDVIEITCARWRKSNLPEHHQVFTATSSQSTTYPWTSRTGVLDAPRPSGCGKSTSSGRSPAWKRSRAARSRSVAGTSPSSRRDIATSRWSSKLRPLSAHDRPREPRLPSRCNIRRRRSLMRRQVAGLLGLERASQAQAAQLRRSASAGRARSGHRPRPQRS